MNNSIRIIRWAGIALLFIPFLGVLHSVKSVSTVIVGVIVIVYSFRIQRIVSLKKEQQSAKPSETTRSVTPAVTTTDSFTI